MSTDNIDIFGDIVTNLAQILNLIRQGVLSICQLGAHLLEVGNLLIEFHQLLSLLSRLFLSFDDLLQLLNLLLCQTEFGLEFPGEPVDMALHDSSANVFQVVEHVV